MGVETIIFIVLLALLIVALLVVPMFTNKRRAKQTNELHNSLKPGDLVKTIGGVIGTIIEIRQISPTDKEMVIETGVGDNKTTMVFDLQALYQVMSRSSTIVPAKDEAEESAQPEEQSAENAEPARVVPDILADRTPEPEKTVEPEQKAEEPEADATAEPEAQPEQAATKEEAVEEKPEVEKPAQKSGAGKKPNNGGKKNGK